MKLTDLFKLTRIEHSAMLVMAVATSEFLASGGALPSITAILLSFISPIFISAASFAINDYFDIEVDRLNKKNRPLVSGRIKPNTAAAIATSSYMIGIAASAFLNAYCFIIALIFAILSFLYSYRLKETLLMGNSYIALSMAIPFIFGNYVVSKSLYLNVLLVAVMIFISGLAREIHGTIRDYKGDIKIRNANTLPKSIGIKGSAIAALILYASAIALSVYLFLYVKPFAYNHLYAVMISITDVILACVSIGFLYKKSSGFYNLSRNASLAAMGLALVCFLVISFLYT